MTTTQIDAEARATLETDRKARERRRRQLGQRLKASLPEWRRETVNLAILPKRRRGSGARQVEANVYRGLAVHKHADYDPAGEHAPLWTISHVDSGLAAYQGAASERQAMALVVRLAALADWTQPMEALTSNPAAREAIRLLRERWAHDPYGPGPDLPGEGEA